LRVQDWFPARGNLVTQNCVTHGLDFANPGHNFATPGNIFGSRSNYGRLSEARAALRLRGTGSQTDPGSSVQDPTVLPIVGRYELPVPETCTRYQ
jgi:hypothetical protein